MLKKLTRLIKKDYGSCAAVIVAAGTASRMDGIDKVFAPLDGEPLISRTVAVFQESPVIREIVIVTREDLLDRMSRLCHGKGFDKVTLIVTGGETRVHSVMKGLDSVSRNTDLVAVHDGARPFVTPQIIEQTVRRAADRHAAAPAVPVKDTVKTAENHVVTGTPDRASLYAVQTPQVFDFDLLRGALQNALDKGLPITDDCSAVEDIGMSVFLTQGSDENIKVTTPMDLLVAEAILKHRREAQ